MVYKKIIKRGGKVYGPYLYENKRVGNKVITTYVGRDVDIREKKIFGYLPYVLGFIFFSLAVFFILSNFYPTGKVALTLDESYEKGELIKGNLKLTLKEGELLPKDSRVLASLDNQNKEFILSDLVNLGTIKGDFFVEGAEITGGGDGYGLIGARESYPTIDFEIETYNLVGDSSVNDEKEEKGTEEGEKIIEESEKKSEGEKKFEEKPEGIKGEEKTEEERGEKVVEESFDSEPEASVENNEITVGTTGAIISESEGQKARRISGKVSKEQKFEFEFQEGENVRVVEESVRHGDSAIGDDKVKIEIIENKVIVKTDYSIIEEGFGGEFIGDKELVLDIDLSKLNINVSESGTFRIEINYEGKEIIDVEKNIEVGEDGIEKTLPLMNETNVSVNISINVSTNISQELNVSVNLTKEDFENITLKNISIKTLRYKIRVGEPVRWIKNITLKEAKEIAVELPGEAENISVKKVENKGEKEALVKIRGLTGNVISGRISVELELDKERSILGLLKKIFRKLTGRVTGKAVADLGLNETNQSVIDIVLADNATQYIIEYYTDAPQVSEEQKENGKKVIVSGPDNLNYTDVLVYSNLTKKMQVSDSVKIRVYWYNYDYAEKEAVLKNVDDVQEIEIVDEKGGIAEEISQEASGANESVANESQISNEEVNNTVEDIDNNAIENNEFINETDENNSKTNSPLIVGDSLISGRAVSEDNSSDRVDRHINISIEDNENENLNFSESEILADERGISYVKQEIPFEVYDVDEDGYIDYIEWVAPHLSNQTFEIIEITKAEHLNENREFIEDVYDFVRAQDNNWTSPIQSRHYVRVTFEQNLTRDKDITIYAKASCTANSTVKINGVDVPCEIYKKKLRLDKLRRQG